MNFKQKLYMKLQSVDIPKDLKVRNHQKKNSNNIIKYQRVESTGLEFTNRMSHNNKQKIK